MFEGLDQIDWQSLGYHVYGRHEIIPQEIRHLLSENAEVRQEAREFLLGGGQDIGDIYDTTPHIIPFLFEILDSPDGPDKDLLLYHLSVVADHSLNPARASIHMLRLCLQTHDALKAGLGILIALLDDPTPEVRAADAGLLECMTDEVESLIPELIRSVRKEGDEEIQIALLTSLKRLLHSLDWRHSGLREQYAPFFKELVETHPSRKVRVAAARASVELLGQFKGKQMYLSPEIPGLLTQEFLDVSARLDHRKLGTDFFHAEQVARDLARLANHEPLLTLMQIPTLSPEQAHIIARALMAAMFLYGLMIESHWERFPNHDRRAEGLFYLQHLDATRSMRMPFMYKARRPYLQAILEAEKVWEIPTNLFSSFYGLPDSREGWQAMMENFDAQEDGEKG
jgi:hypothetical protein